MGLQELRAKQEQLQNQMLKQIKEDSILLRVLADNMAECATNIQGQGYATFLQARENFLTELDRLYDDYCFLVCPERPTKCC